MCIHYEYIYTTINVSYVSIYIIIYCIAMYGKIRHPETIDNALKTTITWTASGLSDYPTRRQKKGHLTWLQRGAQF